MKSREMIIEKIVVKNMQIFSLFPFCKKYKKIKNRTPNRYCKYWDRKITKISKARDLPAKLFKK